MKLFFYYLLSKIEECLHSALTGAATLNSKGREREREGERESKILGKKDHFRSLSKLTSVENAKSEESKEINHFTNKTFSFVNIGSVVCFPMPISTKFELEVAKICISVDDNLLVL